MSTVHKRHRITTAQIEQGGRQFTITFQPDGIHVHERYGREDKIIPIAELLGMKAAPAETPSAPAELKGKKADPRYKSESISERLDLGACDLSLLADMMHRQVDATRDELAQIKESVQRALKIVRSLEVIT